jgi:hypothetical protein
MLLVRASRCSEFACQDLRKPQPYIDACADLRSASHRTAFAGSWPRIPQKLTTTGPQDPAGNDGANGAKGANGKEGTPGTSGIHGKTAKPEGDRRQGRPHARAEAEESAQLAATRGLDRRSI